MLNLIFIDFFDNFIFYNFLNDYKNKHVEQFIINFNIKYIEGNFPHSFFTQYNYLKLNNYYLVDKTKILDILNINKLSLCLDLNNINLQEQDLNDKYLLMILSTLNNKNYYIHCNSNNIIKKLNNLQFKYIYINETNFIDINTPIKNIQEENYIYTFSNIKTQFNNNIKINFNNLNKNQTYRIMINNIDDIILNLIKPQYQFIFYREFLKYEKTFYITRFLGK